MLDKVFAQEGTITPLSISGDKVTILHQSNPASVSHLSDMYKGVLPPLHSVAEDNEMDRVISIYSGDLSAEIDHAELLANLEEAGHDVAGLSRDALLMGQAQLAAALSTFADFPHLASNLVVENGAVAGLMRPFTETTLANLRVDDHQGGIYDGLVVDADGVLVCLFGLVDPATTASGSDLPAGMFITDPIEAAGRMVALCEAHDADLIVTTLTLSTQYRLDNEIKSLVAGIDVFVLGGFDSALDPQNDMPISVVNTDKGSSISVQDTGLGRLDLTLTANPMTLLYEFDPNFLSVSTVEATEPDRTEGGISLALILIGAAVAGAALIAGLFILRGS
jgi:hypothetical protein